MCWNECWRESVCGVRECGCACACEGKSAVVGLELGLIECSWCRLLVGSEESEGKHVSAEYSSNLAISQGHVALSDKIITYLHPLAGAVQDLRCSQLRSSCSIFDKVSVQQDRMAFLVYVNIIWIKSLADRAIVTPEILLL